MFATGPFSPTLRPQSKEAPDEDDVSRTYPNEKGFRSGEARPDIGVIRKGAKSTTEIASERNPKTMDRFTACSFGGVVLAGVAVLICFHMKLYRAMTLVSQGSRTISPGLVFLSFVPLLGLVWPFVLAVYVPNALQNEFRARGQDDGSDYGRFLGIFQVTFNITSFAVGFYLPRNMVEVYTVICGAMGSAMLIMARVKIGAYCRQLT